MKKSLLILSAAFISITSGTAQIVVSYADVATPFKIIYQATDTMATTTTLPYGTASATSQTWNMASLLTDITDTLNFLPYSSAPNAAYSTSNLLMKQGWQSNYGYLSNTAASLTNLGFAGTVDFGAGPFTIISKNTPAEKLMTFPATYLTTFTNNFRTVTPAFYLGFDPGIGFTIDSIRQFSSKKKTVVIDAWGSLTTPLGTFNVLRSKETIVKRDTTDVMIFSVWNPIAGAQQISADSTTSYSWWANGIGFSLVNVTLDSAGAYTNVQWLQSLPVVGINEYVETSQVNVYPNPAQNEITFAIEATKVSSIQLYDITGRLLETVAVSKDNVSINTSELANGIYSYALVGKDNSVLNRGKFTIAK